MTAKTSYSEQLDRLLETFFEELQQTSDTEVLAGKRHEDIRQRALARIERTASEAGRRRMDQAKRLVRDESDGPGPQSPNVDLESARAYIAKVATNRLYTLAARQLDDMSADDLLRLYQQIRELEERGDGEQ